jgi:ribosomal protein S15P/S13E
MKNISLITEKETVSFIKAATPEDVEVYFNSLIMIRKHLDIDKDKRDTKYGLKLVSKKPKNVPSYKVGSNAIGIESLRLISKKHNIENGGSENEKSTYIVFYTMKD